MIDGILMESSQHDESQVERGWFVVMLIRTRNEVLVFVSVPGASQSDPLDNASAASLSSILSQFCKGTTLDA